MNAPLSTETSDTLNDSTPTKANDTASDTMVRKDPESPTISSDTNASEEVKQPTLRLGRVSYVDNGDEKTNIEETTGSAVPANREEELLRWKEDVIQAMDTLSQLASMDSADYRAKLVQSQLPSLQLVPPSFQKLSQSIHRFHSVVNNLTTENDHQIYEIIQLQKQVDSSQQRIDKLEEAVAKLHSRHLKLKKQSKSDKNVARKLLQQVQDFTSNAAKKKEEKDFQQLAAQVQYHEQQLMRTSSCNFGSQRERTDSNFSDLDVSDIYSDQASVQSLVTDDGIATVRIARERTNTWPTPTLQDDFEAELTGGETAQDAAEVPASISARPVLAADSNPFAMFLGPRVAQPYTLSFEAPCTLQFTPLLVTKTTKDDSQSEPQTETAFAVCGYHDFDSNANVKPTLGARLIRINKEDLDATWTVQDLEEHIKSKGKRVSLTFRNDNWNREQKGALQMAVEEQERLHPSAASQGNHQMAPFLRKRSQSSEAAVKGGNNLLGFLNFNHHNSGNVNGTKSAKEPKDTIEGQSTKPDTPPQEPATKTTPEKDGIKTKNNAKGVSPARVMASMWKAAHSPVRGNTSGNSRNTSQEQIVTVDEDADLEIAVPSSDEETMTKDGVVVVADNENEQTAPEESTLPPSHERESPEHVKKDWQPGCVVKLTGLPETCTRDAILDAVGVHLGVSVQEVRHRKICVDFQPGPDGHGAVRFSVAHDHIADMAKHFNNGELQILDATIGEASVLEGDEEKEYWEKFFRHKTKQHQHRQQSEEQQAQAQQQPTQPGRLKESMKNMGKMFAFR